MVGNPTLAWAPVWHIYVGVVVWTEMLHLCLLMLLYADTPGGLVMTSEMQNMFNCPLSCGFLGPTLCSPDRSSIYVGMLFAADHLRTGADKGNPTVYIIKTKHCDGLRRCWRNVISAQCSECQSDEIQTSAGKRRE